MIPAAQRAAGGGTSHPGVMEPPSDALASLPSSEPSLENALWRALQAGAIEEAIDELWRMPNLQVRRRVKRGRLLLLRGVELPKRGGAFRMDEARACR